MTTAGEIAAYNAGLTNAAALARAAADRLALRVTRAPTRLNFAIEALDSVADAAESLRLPEFEKTAPPICGDPAPDGTPVVAIPAAAAS